MSDLDKQIKTFNRQLKVFCVVMIVLAIIFGTIWFRTIRWDLILPLFKS